MLIPRSFSIILTLMPARAMVAFARTPQSSPSPLGSAPAITRTVFTEKSVDASLSRKHLHGAVPSTTVQTALDGYRTRLGPLGSVEPAGTDFAIIFKRGSVVATIALDASNKTMGLLEAEPLHENASNIGYLSRNESVSIRRRACVFDGRSRFAADANPVAPAPITLA